ncbi:hypothetical protein AYI72_06380 [Shewanella algae]|nr:hypothetical protein AYI72_06380 [Shewanella algae]
MFYRKVRDRLNHSKLHVARIETSQGFTSSFVKFLSNIEFQQGDLNFSLENVPVQTKYSPTSFCDFFLGMDFLYENLIELNFEKRTLGIVKN